MQNKVPGTYLVSPGDFIPQALLRHQNPPARLSEFPNSQDPGGFCFASAVAGTGTSSDRGPRLGPWVITRQKQNKDREQCVSHLPVPSAYRGDCGYYDQREGPIKSAPVFREVSEKYPQGRSREAVRLKTPSRVSKAATFSEEGHSRGAPRGTSSPGFKLRSKNLSRGTSRANDSGT